jgi:hypothetical protein
MASPAVRHWPGRRALKEFFEPVPSSGRKATHVMGGRPADSSASAADGAAAAASSSTSAEVAPASFMVVMYWVVCIFAGEVLLARETLPTL